MQPPWTLVSSKHCCLKLVSSSANRTTDAQVCGNRDGESAPACRQVLKRYEWGLFSSRSWRQLSARSSWLSWP